MKLGNKLPIKETLGYSDKHNNDEAYLAPSYLEINQLNFSLNTPIKTVLHLRRDVF